MAKISVITPTYNREKFIVKAIDSVLQQTHEDYEIIVVDDGSTDETRKILEPYATRIRYLYQSNAGVSAARNRGIKEARGDWVAFLDSDDEWLPGYLRKQAEMISRYPDIVGSVMNSVNESPEGRQCDTFEDRGLYRLLRGRDKMLLARPFRTITEYSVTALQACVFRRTALLSTRLFDEEITISEDWDLVAQMALQGSFVFCREIQARIIRRGEDAAVNLSSQFTLEGIRTRLAWARVFSRFLGEENLAADERRALSDKFAASQRALGNLYVRAGTVREARDAYRQAWSLDRSVKSCGKLALSYLPAVFGRALWLR
jgi:glycosyltransferase involved in cell wall biosynthesis